MAMEPYLLAVAPGALLCRCILAARLQVDSKSAIGLGPGLCMYMALLSAVCTRSQTACCCCQPRL